MNILDEEVFGLSELAAKVPRLNGRKPHTSTLWRWCRKGCRGVQLEYVKVGGRIATSLQSLDRFFNQLAAADPAPKPTLSTIASAGLRPRSEKARTKAIEAARQKLEEAGI